MISQTEQLPRAREMPYYYLFYMIPEQEFLNNITQEKLWSKCGECDKCQNCHIYRNRNLIIQNKKRVNEFITMHYIWLTEHGRRLTIRSMTEQLAYMITGGADCSSIVSAKPYKY